MPEAKKKTNRQLIDMASRALFQHVPFNLAVIDRDFNIVQANDNFAEHFGEWQGKKCYAVYKKLDHPCEDCPSAKVFRDGRVQVSEAVGFDKYGRQVHYIGHSIPLRSDKNGPIECVLEMTRPVTETGKWQQEYQILFDRVPCYITVIDRNYQIVRANESFRDRFGDVHGHYCYQVYKRRNSKCPNCPAAKTFRDQGVHRSNKVGTGRRGEDIHYAVTTAPLTRGEDQVSHVIEISNDLTAVKRLEQQVIEAERLSAVGQTVAGLAHSIKNMLMGLEGGKYIVSLGLQKNDKQMISEGWEMLERNFEKTTTLVKDFLSFSKGRVPKLRMVQPKRLIQEIVDLYKEIAAQSGITLTADVPGPVKSAPLDPDGIHTCLTNLVSNAIDACLMGERKGSEVTIRVRDGREKLVFEVEDNGSGIDYDLKKKIFTTFFTTKGGEGTGLGLLTTRKIVQEHGGRIHVDSRPGAGARFRMEFPRKRLLALHKQSAQNQPREKR